jgi:SNF2 family DNA or RNA helicase
MRERSAPKAQAVALDFDSCDGSKTARDYQKTGIEFILDSEFNCVIGDQMRLGKTPQSLLALKNAYAQRTPVLILVRAANLWQWIREYKVWTDSLPLGIYPIVGTKNYIPQGFSAYIISMDTFSRGDMSDRLLKFGFKLCIVDEAHSFKNTDSNRSQALLAFLREINRAEITHVIPFTCMICKHQWEESVTIQIKTSDATQRVSKHTVCPKCFANASHAAQAHVKVSRKCGVIMLTGTAIKNRADEYFVPLNILAPDKFPSLQHFRQRYLRQDSKGKWTRLDKYMYDDFMATIKPYVLRREKEDVYTDLPELNRMFTVIEIDDKRLKEAYNKVLDKLEREIEIGHAGFFENIGDLMILRQICGLAKVKWTSDYVETMLCDSDKAKVAIGIHHHSVRDTLAYNLSQFGVMKLSGEDSAERKDRIMTEFESNAERCLVINMLAGGVGMDFHYVSNVVILERQWSSADEEQFEFRFYNPDKSIKTAPTNIEYVIAKGTIDEWFYDLVEEKRRIFGETIGTNWNLQADTQSFKMLLEKTVANRL